MDREWDMLIEPLARIRGQYNHVHKTLNYPTLAEMRWLPERLRDQYREKLQVLYNNAPKGKPQ